MVIEIAVRFVLGGLIVCAFAVIGDLWKPKSFAGIFGAAPSVALATLGLTFISHGPSYASIEGRSMLLGAAGFLAYSLVVGWVLLGRRLGAIAATGSSWLVWLTVSIGLWVLFLR